MTTVQHLPILVLVVKRTVCRTDLHGTAVGVRLNVGIRIRVFARKESLLSHSFPVIHHSLIRTWAFTLGKMNDVFEAVGLVWLLLVSTNLLVHLVLLLTSQSLLKLKLLLKLLLLVGQNRVFTLWLATGLVVQLFLVVLGWSHYSSHKSV